MLDLHEVGFAYRSFFTPSETSQSRDSACGVNMSSIVACILHSTNSAQSYHLKARGKTPIGILMFAGDANTLRREGSKLFAFFRYLRILSHIRPGPVKRCSWTLLKVHGYDSNLTLPTTTSPFIFYEKPSSYRALFCQSLTAARSPAQGHLWIFLG